MPAILARNHGCWAVEMGITSTARIAASAQTRDKPWPPGMGCTRLSVGISDLAPSAMGLLVGKR